MKLAFHKSQSQAGVTFVEAALVMVIMSVMGMGLVSSVITVVDHYQNDLVGRDIRAYGHVVLDEIAEKISMAKTVKKQPGPSNELDILYLTYADKPGRTFVLQPTHDDGFLWNRELLIKKRPLQSFGSYRDEGQREIELVQHKVYDMYDINYEGVVGGRGLTAVAESVFEVNIQLKMTTNHRTGESTEEYFHFRRKVYATGSLIEKMYGGGNSQQSSSPGGSTP